ncbi:MAG: transposase [bacterium]|nr:transposase [bacterium]
MNYRRVFVPNSYVHIIMVAYKRKPIFIDNIDLLRKAFENSKKYYQYEIISICVLPDHIHLIINPNNTLEYPKIITSIKYYFSKNYDVGVETPTYGYTNKGEKGVFQRRYFEHTIINQDDLNNHIDYIHYNPVKHGLVKNVKDWEYSSFLKFVKHNLYDKNWGSSKDINNFVNLSFE